MTTTPALIWQSNIEVLIESIQRRHEVLLAQFDKHIWSPETLSLLERIQQHVNTCWMRDGSGLLIWRR